MFLGLALRILLPSADGLQEGRNSCSLLRSCFIGSCYVGVSKRFSRSVKPCSLLPESNPGHIGGRRALSPLHSHQCAIPATRPETVGTNENVGGSVTEKNVVSALQSFAGIELLPESNPGHIGGRRALSPLHSHQCAIPATRPETVETNENVGGRKKKELGQ